MRRNSALVIPIAILVLAAPLAAKSSATLKIKSGTTTKTSAAKSSASKNKTASKKSGAVQKVVGEQTKVK